MSMIQRIAQWILPARVSESMLAESESWRITCLTCGNSKSVREAGGIRWKAASVGKRTLVRCSDCGALKMASIEWKPTEAKPTEAKPE